MGKYTMSYPSWTRKYLGGIMKMPYSIITSKVPRPWRFVLGRTECVECMNGFGSGRGFHLGSIEYIYHPMCLISLKVACRCCALYKAPFHERLYEYLIWSHTCQWARSVIQRILLGYSTHGMKIWCGVGNSMVTPTIKAMLALNLDGRMIVRVC
jgi:hypothetical protein